MVTYRDNGHLSTGQRHYNIVHSAARSVIERAFGRLKGKFRRLKNLDVTRTDLAPLVIEAACALHNLTLQENEQENEEDDVGRAADNPDESEDITELQPSSSSLRDAARLKRDAIMQQL